MIFTAMTFLSCNVSNINTLKCLSMNNQECKVRPQIKNINSNEPSFYHYSVKINKCSVVAIMLIIHMQNYVLLMLLKT